MIQKYLAKYLDFTDVFLKESVMALLKYLDFNKNTIDLKKNKKLPYKRIYSLRLAK